MTRALLLGCGNRKERLPYFAQVCSKDVPEFVSVDINPHCAPDRVFDLNAPYWDEEFDRNSFDEVHAYEVLEHLGQQGDFIRFFQTFRNIWSVLKPGGILCATTPTWCSQWTWGDPGHTRVISQASLTFLHQPSYTQQVGKSAMTDYRHWWRGDFDVIHSHEDTDTHAFCLRAVKPSRISV